MYSTRMRYYKKKGHVTTEITKEFWDFKNGNHIIRIGKIYSPLHKFKNSFYYATMEISTTQF